MTNSTDYMTIDQAFDVPYTPGQFWELHPDVTLSVQFRDDEGYVTDVGELTDRAAIMDLESITDGCYRLYGNQDGDSFNVEVNIDGDTLVRLVDER
jgi:hypothetical protein